MSTEATVEEEFDPSAASMKWWAFGVVGLLAVLAMIWIGRSGLGQLGAVAGDQSTYSAALADHRRAEDAAWLLLRNTATERRSFYAAAGRLAMADRKMAGTLQALGSTDQVRRDAEALRASLLDSAAAEDLIAGQSQPSAASDALLRAMIDREQQHPIEAALSSELGLPVQ